MSQILSIYLVISHVINPKDSFLFCNDAQLTALSLYVNVWEQKPSMFDVSREMGSSVALYSRKVLIQTKATDILPKWLRFLRGQMSVHMSMKQTLNALLD